MGTIKGIVRNTADKPLTDVNLVIVAGPPHSDIVAVTGSDGTFEFSSLRPGKYIIKAYGQVESDEIPVRVFAQQIPFVEIWLDMMPPNQKENMVDEENYFRGESYFNEENYFSEDGN